MIALSIISLIFFLICGFGVDSFIEGIEFSEDEAYSIVLGIVAIIYGIVFSIITLIISIVYVKSRRKDLSIKRMLDLNTLKQQGGISNEEYEKMKEKCIRKI